MNPTRRVQLPAGSGAGGVEVDTVAVEEPLEIRVEGVAAAITMRTPGDDLDLAIGFLATEGVIGADDGMGDAMGDVRAILQVSENVVDVRLSDGVSPARARSADRAMYATSSCGVCGKASLDRILRGRSTRLAAVAPPDTLLARLPAAFDAAQVHTHATGCMHAAALFSLSAALVAAPDPEPIILLAREDVGRHNAVDKVLGARLRSERMAPEPVGEPFDGLGLVVTSRAGFEVVQKAVTVGIGVVCTVGAPTSLAIDLARESGCVLIAWLREGRWRRYA